MNDILCLIDKFTNPFLSICVTHADFWHTVQKSEKLSSSSLGFGIIWSEGGSSAKRRPTDHYG